ncbi:MAG: hypothetical protein U0457_14485 [Candidatus Sericytochromatia bacterium]
MVHKKNKYNIFKFKNILIVFFLVFSLNSFADIEYPEYIGKKVIDISGKFDESYLSNLENQTSSYEYEMRILFLDTKGKINLAFYAPKLFEMWKMDENSVLVVIDPYLNKFGYSIGKEVRKKLKEKNVSESNKELSSDKNKTIDYDNLARAIDQKFLSPRAINKSNENKKNKTLFNSEASSSYRTSGRNYNTNNNSSINFDKLKKYLIIFVLIASLIGIIFYFINKKKQENRKIELKTNYTFDADVLIQNISDALNKLNSDLEKMERYLGLTKKELEDHIVTIKDNIKKSEKFIKEITEKLENLEDDEIYDLKDLIDKGNIILPTIDKLHLDSVNFRKEFKSIQENSEMKLSEIRVNIENCKSIIDETKILFPFTLNDCDERVNDVEAYFYGNKIAFDKEDPLSFRYNIQSLLKKLSKIKKDLSIIPHLYKQLQDDIPLNIDSYLEESLLDNNTKNKIKAKVTDFRNNALISLSNGNLSETEELINKIFKVLNDNTNKV